MEPIWMSGCTGEFGCSCPEKRKAATARLRNLQGHGTRKKYQKGCRCPTCTKANTKYSRDLKERNGTA